MVGENSPGPEKICSTLGHIVGWCLRNSCSGKTAKIKVGNPDYTSVALGQDLESGLNCSKGGRSASRVFLIFFSFIHLAAAFEKDIRQRRYVSDFFTAVTKYKISSNLREEGLLWAPS